MQFLILLAFASLAHADFSIPGTLVNPLTCGNEFRNAPVVIHHGGSIFTRGPYTTTLSFKSQGEFSVSSNWGPDLKDETVNAIAMTDHYAYGLLQHLALNGNADNDCSKSGNECAISVVNLLDQVAHAVDETHASGAQKDRESRARECADSIALSTMKRSFAKTDTGRTLPVQTLSFNDSGRTRTRMERVRKDRDDDVQRQNTQTAANNALILSTIQTMSTTSSSYSSSYSSSPGIR